MKKTCICNTFLVFVAPAEDADDEKEDSLDVENLDNDEEDEPKDKKGTIINIILGYDFRVNYELAITGLRCF